MGRHVTNITTGANRDPLGNHNVILLSEFEILKVFARNNWDKELRDLLNTRYLCISRHGSRTRGYHCTVIGNVSPLSSSMLKDHDPESITSRDCQIRGAVKK